MLRKPIDVLAALLAYLRKYVIFPNTDAEFAVALWIAATFHWPQFDAFPYLVITSATKRSGKTRLGIDLCGFTASNARAYTALTPATVFKSIRDEHPTLLFDEAEKLSNSSDMTMRQVLNAGYRKGGNVPRLDAESETGITEWPVYCPKLFVLIGDVNDTLRDRSIVLWMRRAREGELQTRFIYRVAQDEGRAIQEDLADVAGEIAGAVLNAYETLALPFLPDRDEEIWLPLFAVCHAYAPERERELRRIAVDLSADKTRDAAYFRELEGVESDVEADEYRRRLLRDLAAVMDGHRVMFTADVIRALRAIEVAPWRKFKGDGLTPESMADLLSPCQVRPRLLKIRGKAARGYRREDVRAALAKL